MEKSSKGLVISLMAVAVMVSAPLSHASPVVVAQATAQSSSSNQPDVKAMVEQADKLRSERRYNEAAVIWRQILDIAEKVLGPENPSVATILSDMAELLQEQEQYAAAEQLYRRSLAIREKALGPNHPDVATSLNFLLNLFLRQRQYEKAEPFLISLLAINKKTLGADHPGVAQKLNDLAILYTLQKKYDKAEPLFNLSLIIREKTLGSYHIDVAETLSAQASLYARQKKYSKAELIYLRVLAIQEKALGANHPAAVATLSALAALYVDQVQYEKAEPLLNRILSIRQKSLGPDHLDVAKALNDLVFLHVLQKQYDKADALNIRAISIQEKALGENHVEIAYELDKLALRYLEQGQYSRAERLYNRSLAIRENARGPLHPDVAGNIDTIALLYRLQGQNSKAEALYSRALAIREKALGPNHSDVATSLNNLADLYGVEGNYAKAEPLYLRAIEIQEKGLGVYHPSLASSLSGLANAYIAQGRHVKAEPLYQRSIAITEKALGPSHPQVAKSLGGLALAYNLRGEYKRAEEIISRYLQAVEMVLAPDSPARSIFLTLSASLYSMQGNHEKAISSLDHSFSIESAWLTRELPMLPASARSAQLRASVSGWELAFHLVSRDHSAAKLALQFRFNRQGLVQEIEQRQSLLLNAPGVDRAKVEQLQALTEQLASVSLPPERRTAVREQRDNLQSELYRQNPELEIQLVTPTAVAKALPSDGALVEFQRYRPFDGRKPRDQRWVAAQYVALVLKPNGNISAVPLGPAAVIDATVQKGLLASAEQLSDTEAIWAQLSNQVFKPLLPQLSGSRQWFLSPDGELNRVPFAALPAPQQPNTPLAQAVQLRLLTTGRELVRLQQPASAGSKALVMANPSYDRPSTKPAPAARPNAVANASQRRSVELGSKHWAPLPASEREGQQVASLLGTGLISGTAATTTALQRQQGPRVLHVATHGFFVADQESKPTDAMRAIQDNSTILRSLRQEDPQLRSGLVLAGANQPALDTNDDGYLTAAEALNLNLKGTELVVLSACSTGQGEARTGEGVYGLQRSLTVAGARSTLLSLWKVNDAATAEFMTRYYTRLKAGEARSDALAATQQEFRDGTAGGGQWKDPYYWAAWQLVGDWRPIQGL